MKSDKENLEVQLSNLKVEADLYKLEINKLKKEREEIVAEDIKTTLSTSGNTDNTPGDLNSEQPKIANAEQIKMQLDGFIEDIDQCIQIIQTK